MKALAKILAALKAPAGRWLVKTFLSTRLGLAAFASISALLIPVGKFASFVELGKAFALPQPLHIWIRWDAAAYLNIASIGYSYVPGEMSTVAWFPLYPALMRALSFFGTPEGLVVAGLIISYASLFIAAGLLYKLMRLDFDGASSKRAVLYLLIFPASVFLSSIYAEPLFLALLLAAFYFARKGRWWLAGIAGYFAALTRSIGIVLLIALAIEFAMQHRFKLKEMLKSWKSTIPIAFVPAGVLTYAALLYFLFSEPFAFLSAQSAFFGRALGIPLSSFAHPFIEPRLYVFMLTAFAVFGLVALVQMWGRLRTSYVVYTLAALGVPLSTGTLEAIHRFEAVIFPIFMMMALWGSSSKAHKAIVLVSVVLLLVFTAAFVNGYEMH